MDVKSRGVPQDSDATVGAKPRRYRNQTHEERRHERREKLLRAGIEMFATKGYHVATIDLLCTAAGVSTRNFYEEFGSKESLLLDIYDATNQRALTAAVDALGDHRDSLLEVRVRRALEAYLDAILQDPRMAQVVYIETASVSPIMEEHRRQVLEAFQALIVAEGERAATEGVIAGRDLTLTAVAVAGAIRELAIYATTTEGVTISAAVDEAVALIMSAVSPTAGR